MAITDYAAPLKRVLKAICYLAVLAIGCTFIVSAAITPADSQESTPVVRSLEPLFDAPESVDRMQANGTETKPIAQPSFEANGMASIETISLPPFENDATTNADWQPIVSDQPSSQVRTVNSNSSADSGQASMAVWNTPANMISETPAIRLPADLPLAIGPTYRLQQATWQSFERQLRSTWGDRLEVATSSDGRYARAMVPSSMNSSVLPILIDRESNLLTFEGTAEQFESWQSIIPNLDKGPGDGRVVFINMKNVDQSRIVQAAYMMGFQDETPPAQLPDQNLPQDQSNTGETTRALRFPNEQIAPRQRPVLFTQDVPGVQGPVQIKVIPGMGIIILEGAAADVAAVEAMIKQIVDTSGLAEATQAQILLENAQSTQVAERLQELYDTNYAESKGPASISPWDTPNSLIVIGQPDSIRVIQDLVEKVDVKQPPGVEVATNFKVYRLKFISANDAKIRVDQLLGQSNITGNTEDQPPALPSRSTADFRSNTLAVWASKSVLAQVDELIRALDVDGFDAQDGAVNVVKVVALRNALASELQPVIQDVLNGQLQNSGQGLNNDPTGQNAQNFNQQNIDPQGLSSSLRSVALEFLSEQGEKTRSTITFDIRITADTNSNSLIISGPEKSIPFVEALIHRLDTIPDAETVIKVFPIVNGDAASLLETLNTLFTGATQGQQQQGGQQTGVSQLPLQSDTAEDGITLANIRFSLDERTNTIIASGTAGDMSVVESLITRLDVENFDNRKTFTYKLSNLQAQEVADAINEWLENRQQFIQDDPTLVNAIAQVRRQVSVTPVAVPNSLIISAVPEYFDEVVQLVQDLDRRPNTVKVKVLLAEIDLETAEEFGIDVGVQNSLLFDRGTAAGINFAFNQSAIGNADVGRGTLAGQALSNLGVGRVNSTLGYGGLVLSAGNDSVSFLLRALENKRCLRILSKPHVMTLENLQGRIFSGASVPRVIGSDQNNISGGVANQIQDEEVGLILGITPRVSPDGTIVMFVDAQKSAVGDEQDGIAIQVSQNGQVIRSPQILRTQIQTTIQARHGQTVVISGLIQETKAHFKRGTPILSDLPVIGPLFTFEGDSAQRTELLVILTPYLVNSDDEMGIQNQDEINRMHWCESDVAEIYGNTEYGAANVVEPEVFYPDLDPTGLQRQSSESNYLGPAQPVYESDATQLNRNN